MMRQRAALMFISCFRKHFARVTTAAGAFAIATALATSAAFAGTSVTPGYFIPSGGTAGFGGNISTDLAGFGPAKLRGAATLGFYSLRGGENLQRFGLGADFVGSQGRAYFGGGANVFFTNISGIGEPAGGSISQNGSRTDFVPDLLLGVHIAPLTSLEARYYFTPSDAGGGTFFAGLRFDLP